MSGLASRFNISTEGAHGDVHDVQMIVKTEDWLKITQDPIIYSQITWSDSIKKVQNTETSNFIIKTLDPLKDYFSIGMRKKMVIAIINFDDVIKTFRADKDVGF